MKGLALIAVLVIAGLVFLWAADKFRVWNVKRQRKDRWELDEFADGGVVKVVAHHPVNDDLQIAAVPFGDENFEYQLEAARSEGYYKISALNSTKKKLKK